MSRVKLPDQGEFPYHICARTVNREWFQPPLDFVWTIFEEQLYFLHVAYAFEIHGFVLMNNHFHLLVRTPDCNLSEGMRWLMKETSRYINQEAGRINQVWGGRFFRSLLTSHHHYMHAYKYVYCNPLRAQLSARAHEYPYSTLPGVLGMSPLLTPVHDRILFEMGVENCLNWLDARPSEDDWETVRRGLKFTTFHLAKSAGDNRESHLETQLL